MKEIQLYNQPFYKPNTKNELKPSGEISGSFILIGTFKGFVLASSKIGNETYLIKLYKQAIFSKKIERKTLIKRILNAFDKLSNSERSIIMDGYNLNGTINKSLN